MHEAGRAVGGEKGEEKERRGDGGSLVLISHWSWSGSCPFQFGSLGPLGDGVMEELRRGEKSKALLKSLNCSLFLELYKIDALNQRKQTKYYEP